MPHVEGLAADGPEPMIAHGSVYLRPAERADLPLFVAWMSDERTTRTLASVAPMGLAGEERWFERLQEQHGAERWHFVVCRMEDARAVGVIDLHAIDLVTGSAGLGIVIGDPADTGRGHGTDALRALLRFGFGRLRLERIWLDVDDDNDRARHIYRKVGFTEEGVLRHAMFRGGEHRDLVRMAILAGEWRGRGAD